MRELPSPPEQQHVEGVAAAAKERAVHAGAADGHARHAQAQRHRALTQQAVDVGCGHMAFDHVAAHQRGVAGAVLLRHPQALACGDVAGVEGAHAEAVFFEVSDPVVAAAALGVFPDLHHGQGAARLRQRKGGGQGQQGGGSEPAQGGGAAQ